MQRTVHKPLGCALLFLTVLHAIAAQQTHITVPTVVAVGAAVQAAADPVAAPERVVAENIVTAQPTRGRRAHGSTRAPIADDLPSGKICRLHGRHRPVNALVAVTDGTNM